MKQILFLLISSRLLVGCSYSEPQDVTPPIIEPDIVIIDTTPPPTTEERIKRVKSLCKFSGSIKTFSIEDSSLTIEYTKNYSEYRQVNPDAYTTASDYDGIVNNEEEAMKVVFTAIASAFLSSEMFNSLSITVYTGEKKYSLKCEKVEVLDALEAATNGKITKTDEEFIDFWIYSKPQGSMIKMFHKVGGKVK